MRWYSEIQYKLCSCRHLVDFWWWVCCRRIWLAGYMKSPWSFQDTFQKVAVLMNENSQKVNLVWLKQSILFCTKVNFLLLQCTDHSWPWSIFAWKSKYAIFRWSDHIGKVQCLLQMIQLRVCMHVQRNIRRLYLNILPHISVLSNELVFPGFILNWNQFWMWRRHLLSSQFESLFQKYLVLIFAKILLWIWGIIYMKTLAQIIHYLQVSSSDPFWSSTKYHPLHLAPCPIVKKLSRNGRVNFKVFPDIDHEEVTFVIGKDKEIIIKVQVGHVLQKPFTHILHWLK